jgi:hypothetical protein
MQQEICRYLMDKSFGFDTAVEKAHRAINAAHVEAECRKWYRPRHVDGSQQWYV